MKHLSRRDFTALAAGAVAAPFTFSAPDAVAAMTAQDVVDRIKKSVGAWKPETIDGFKAGDPSTVVTGIVTTATPTMDVLGRAVKARANFIITAGPTFYARADSPVPAAGRRRGPAPEDRVFKAKADFIAKHGLAVWRFTDHWRSQTPDPFARGLADALGWSKFLRSGDPTRVSVPSMTLDTLSSQVKKRLDGRGGIRVVGDPHMNVQTVGLLPGTTPIQGALALLPAVDVVIAGEVREWESVEYARDKVTAGDKKALILIGRVASENPAMKQCATWLERLVPEVRTTWIPVGDPYWRPL